MPDDVSCGNGCDLVKSADGAWFGFVPLDDCHAVCLPVVCNVTWYGPGLSKLPLGGLGAVYDARACIFCCSPSLLVKRTAPVPTSRLALIIPRERLVLGSVIRWGMGHDPVSCFGEAGAEEDAHWLNLGANEVPESIVFLCDGEPVLGATAWPRALVTGTS